MARVEWLVTHAGSPLYGHAAQQLQIELQQVRRALTENHEWGHHGDHAYGPSAYIGELTQKEPRAVHQQITQ